MLKKNAQKGKVAIFIVFSGIYVICNSSTNFSSFWKSLPKVWQSRPGVGKTCSKFGRASSNAEKHCLNFGGMIF
jgi:hypothetical protein